MKLVDLNWAQDAATRQRIQEDLETSMVVEAAAGTGKTTQLIGRLVAVLASGNTSVERIVAVTFTRKAAGELKLRLREALEQARSDTEDEQVHARVEHAISHLEEARIGTIHSFCAEILRQRPVEAGVDPGFREVADDEGPKLFARAFDRWIQDQLEIMPEGLRRALSRLALESGFSGGVRNTPLERLRDAGWKLAEWRDYPAEWKRPPFEREPLIDRLVDLVARLASHARRCGRRGDPLRRSLEPVVLLHTWIRRAGFDLVPRKPEVESRQQGEQGATSPESVPEQLPDGVLAFPDLNTGLDPEEVEANPFGRTPEERHWTGTLEARDYDALEARLLDLRRVLRWPSNKKRGRGKFAEALPREQVVEERDLFVECLDHFRRVADADLAALLQRELRGVLPEYEGIKQAEGRLDFSDLLLRTRRLLVDSRRVRNELQEQISHLFIDEFQDTDPVQAEVLLLLCADDPQCSDWREVRPVKGKLFAVGDPKQSIYRFRRADVRLYEGIKDRLRENDTAILELGRSFRANANIQHFVNAAFAVEMDGDVDAGRPSYLPLGEYREAPVDQPSVVALPVPEPYGWKGVTQKAIELSQPASVAAFCDWLLNQSGWTVERTASVGGKRVREPVAARDVCILFRRYLSWGKDVTRPYTQALEDRGLTHLLIGARTFHQREEVETLRAALLAIERPDDELACFATLRGSLFSFSDELLMRYRAAVGGFSVFAWQRFARQQGESSEQVDEGSVQPEEPIAEVGDVLRRLAILHRQRNRRAVVETVQELLNWTRARAGFALRPAGHQVLANVERICELARAYEMNGGRSFRGFVERLEAQASRPTSAEAPVIEDGADGVRIMTVHAAKGLEFRVVILADMTANLATREPDHTVDPEAGLCATKVLGCSPLDLIQRMEVEGERDRAEGVRVAYVAATRARDLLVVPAVGDGPRPGWLEPLNKALFPSNVRGAAEAAGCPEFSERSVAKRPMEIEQQIMGSLDPSVQPGLHRFESTQGKHEVVWWDPNVLDLSVRRQVGLARESLLSPKAIARLTEEAATQGTPPANKVESADRDEQAPAVEKSQARYRAWQERRKTMVERGSMPSREVVAVTQLDQDPPAGLRSVEVLSVAGEERASRPSGIRFGELVHSVLRLVDLAAAPDAAVEQAEMLAAMYVRILGATEGEREAAVIAVRNLVEAGIGERLRRAHGIWQEFPIAASIQVNGTVSLVDAVIDLVFLEVAEFEGDQPEGGRLCVVDFKTDAGPLDSALREGKGTVLDKYRRQLSWYAELLGRSGNVDALLGMRGEEIAAGAELELVIVRL